jgi:hypothetical protein
MRQSLLFTLLVFPLALACGGGNPPAQVPAPTASTVAGTPPSSAPADLSPVPDPATIIASGRVAKPSASLATVQAWSKWPPMESQQVTELLTTEAVGPLVDLDQPIDFGVEIVGRGIGMRPAVAVSAAVKDADKAKAAFAEHFKLTPGENGSTVIRGLGRPHRQPGDKDDEGDDSDGGESRPCALMPAAGAAPVRLVCATSAQALKDLGQWLTRTAVNAKTTADLHADVRPQPVQGTLSGKERVLGMLGGAQLASMLGVSAVKDVVAALATDLVTFIVEMDGASIDVTLDPTGADAKATVTMHAARSTTALLATSHPERAGAPPPAFWAMPADADMALFHRGVDDAQFGPMRDVMMDTVSSQLQDDGLKDPDVKAVLAPLSRMLSGAPAVYASGIDVVSTRKAIGAARALGPGADPADVTEARRLVGEGALGWRVMEIDEPYATLKSAATDLVAAWNRPGVAKAYRDASKDSPPPAIRSAPVPKVTGVAALPRDTQHLVLELYPAERRGSMHASPPPPPTAPPAGAHPKPAAPRKPLAIHVFVAGDAQHAWMAIGGDETLVAQKLATSLSSGDAGKLASVAELAPWKTARVGAGGFVTLRAVGESGLALAAIVGRVPSIAGEYFDQLGSLPHQSLVPAGFAITAAQGAASPSFQVEIRAPAGAVEDFVTQMLAHGGL